MSDEKLWLLWTWFLMRANYKTGKALLLPGEEVLKPGQLIYGRRAVAIHTGLSEQELRTRVNKLEKLGYIKRKSTKHYSVITICDWDSYQARGGQEQPEVNQAATTSKEVKNIISCEDVCCDNEGSGGTGKKAKPEGSSMHNRIFQHWLAQGNLTKSPKLTDAMRKKINGKLKDGYTEDDIRKAITNYSRVIASPAHYWSHKWNLAEFMGRGNGFLQFTDDADPWMNYRSKEGTTTTKQPRRRRKEMAQRTVCPVGHIYDVAEHNECPDCARMKGWR